MSTKPKILIVDDSKIMAKLTQKMVESFGYETEVRENSTRAISYIGNHDVDVILMDIELENSMYDGIETCKVIKSRYNIPVIFLTGHENAKIFSDAKLCSMFDVLIKPYDEKMLKMHIDIAVENKKVEGRFRDNELWLNFLLEKQEKASFILDSNGEIIKANKRTEELTDYSSNVIINKNFLDVLPLIVENEKEGFILFSFDELIEFYNDGKKFITKIDNKKIQLNIQIESLEYRNNIIGYFLEIEKR